MITGTTKSGFLYVLDDAALDDYELLEALAAVDRGESASIVSVVDILLGEKQKENLKTHLRKEDGRVSASGMIAEVMEIMKDAGQGNS